ncbi:hypothetical protein D3C75_994680 [compost metagenome]
MVKAAYSDISPTVKRKGTSSISRHGAIKSIYPLIGILSKITKNEPTIVSGKIEISPLRIACI